MKLGNNLKHCLCVLLTLVLLLSSASAVSAYDHMFLENLPLSVDGTAPKYVKSVGYEFQNNRYVSLRDLAAALSGTARQFSLRIEDGNTVIATGGVYSPVGGESEPFPERDAETGNAYVFSTRALSVYPIELDGRALRYQSFLYTDTDSGLQDCFINLSDIAMQLDLRLDVSEAGMTVNTAEGFTLDLQSPEGRTFFYEVNSAVVGDASTGVVYASWEPELSVPIASTTKLMTYMLVMDALREGKISLEDTVYFPAEAIRLSHTANGTIYLNDGAKATVSELLNGMLLPSSNECALALAYHTMGSETAFVEKMNRKAQDIGLSPDAVFYNSNGLPLFLDNTATTKVQNRMSANDMFRLVCHLLQYYPDVTQITSRKSATLSSLNLTVNNSNALLYNLPGVVGLKTGTTNKSGCCLVAALETEDAAGQTHMLVSVVFGAEDSSTRISVSEGLLRYGLQCFREAPAQETATPPEIPGDAESLIRAVLAFREKSEA